MTSRLQCLTNFLNHRPHQARCRARHGVGRLHFAAFQMVERPLESELHPLRDRRELANDSNTGSEEYRDRHQGDQPEWRHDRQNSGAQDPRTSESGKSAQKGSTD